MRFGFGVLGSFLHMADSFFNRYWQCLSAALDWWRGRGLRLRFPSGYNVSEMAAVRRGSKQCKTNTNEVNPARMETINSENQYTENNALSVRNQTNERNTLQN